MSATPVSVRSVVAVADHQVSSELSGEVIILNLQSGIYHGLEEVGARVWGLIKEPAPVHLVRDSLVQEYEVEPTRCEQDLLSLLEELKEHGLLQVRDEQRRADS